MATGRRPSTGSSFDSMASRSSSAAAAAAAAAPVLFTIRKVAMPVSRPVMPSAAAFAADPMTPVELDDVFNFHDPVSEEALVRRTCCTRWRCSCCLHVTTPCTPQKELSGHDDLSAVTYLELSVDATDHSLARIGELVPNLRQCVVLCAMRLVCCVVYLVSVCVPGVPLMLFLNVDCLLRCAG